MLILWGLHYLYCPLTASCVQPDQTDYSDSACYMTAGLLAPGKAGHAL